MTRRLVRKWKVKSAAWAGLTAVLVTAPLSYLLVRSTDDRAAPPGGPVRTHQRSGETPDVGPHATPLAPAPRAEPAPTRGPVDLATLERVARSKEAAVAERARAVAFVGAVPGPEALRLLTTLANEGREGEEPNLVSLAALNALWARGERDLVREIAAESPDPAVKSKALALARMRSR
ncbi:MAG: hypothetical protein M9894_35495 [Planctomycetes bacterium]|nr:hypothetical protein [Planctomycetota bacterium]